MKRENLFYISILVTVLTVRLWVYLIPGVDIKLFEVVIHHYVFGVFFILFAFLFEKKGAMRLLSLAAGMGLVLDQVMFLMLGSGGDGDYWGLLSTSGTAALAVLIYPFRSRLV